MPKRCVRIKAYNNENSLVFDQTLSMSDWYEDLHPVIDSAKFRLEHSIVRVEGVKYDGLGKPSTWVSVYSADGSFIGTSNGEAPVDDNSI